MFAELKKKYKGVFYKRRITLEAGRAGDFLSGAMPSEEFGQIGREIRWFQSFYHTKPKSYIAYDRLAFAGAENPELRITFDTNLRWRRTDIDLRMGDHGSLIIPADQILMEIKIPGASPLWLSRLLAEAGAFPTSFSKYGSCYQNHILSEEILYRKTC